MLSSHLLMVLGRCCGARQTLHRIARSAVFDHLIWTELPLRSPHGMPHHTSALALLLAPPTLREDDRIMHIITLEGTANPLYTCCLHLSFARNELHARTVFRLT